MQKALQDPLAEKILAGEIHDDEVVVIGATPQGLSFLTGSEADDQEQGGRRPPW